MHLEPRSHAPSSRALLAFGICLAFASLDTRAANWPGWRGPNQDGRSTEARFPTEWSPTRNIRWKAPLPERGNSSPVVWGDRIYVTQAMEAEKRRTVICFSRKEGKLLWQQGTEFTGKEATHSENPYCAASPATDGKKVVATFGSAGVFAFDPKGRELWHRDLGPQAHDWGYASSTVIDGDRCYVFHGPGPHSTLVALDGGSGKVLWEQKLPEPVPTERFDGFKGQLPGRIGAFGTPLLIEAGGRRQLVMGLPEQLRAWDPKTGKPLWHSAGLNPLVYTTPAWDGETLVALGGYFGSGLAIKPAAAEGDATSHRLWFEQRARKNRIGSPVIHGPHIYVMNSDGIAECLELGTGKSVWSERLKGPGAKADTWSSFTLAGEKLYMVNQSGDAFVLRASPKFELLAVNSLGEFTNSSFAHSDGELFLRTYNHLWCIAETGKP